MPRLDVWLVENGYAPSRQIAKRMITEGHVSVVGKRAKPSTFVQESDSIQVSNDASTFPIGYKKLKTIDAIMGGKIIQSGDIVLDIGSSAGGFLIYSSEKGAKSIGIEVSQTFFDRLRDIEKNYDDISLIFDDAFTIDPSSICDFKEIDVILIDVTTSVSGTIKLLDKYLPLLKPNGKLVVAFKTNDKVNLQKSIDTMLSKLEEYKLLEINSDKEEIHLIAIGR